MPFLDLGIATRLESLTNGSLAANTLKSLLENPLTFERATFSTVSISSGRFTPLNRPVPDLQTNGTRSPITSESSSDGPNERIPSSVEATNTNDTVLSTEWPKTFVRAPGLKNFGASCYMNSTIQALMHIPPLVTYFLNRTHGQQCTSLVQSLTAGDRGIRTCALCRLERHARDSYPSLLSNRLPHLDPTGIIGKHGGTSTKNSN
jgi:Ubiquitin carboxyl-terminal hydrolase